LDGARHKHYYAVAKTSGGIFGSASMRRRNQRHQHHLLPDPEHPKVVVEPAHPKQGPLVNV
jgi:hypothetical protein